MDRDNDGKEKPRLVDDQGRVKLSPAVCEQLGIEPGDYVTFVVHEDRSVTMHRVRGQLDAGPLAAGAHNDMMGTDGQGG